MLNTKENKSLKQKIRIRPECFRPFSAGWEKPTGKEIKELLSFAKLTGAMVVDLVGLKQSRQVRRWVAEDSPIPYAVWAILCDYIGFEKIWISKK